MKAPIFTTSATRKPKKAKKKTKPEKLVINAPNVRFGFTPNAPLDVAPGKLYIEPRAYFSTVSGLTEWVGISAGIVRLDAADERMNADGYWKSCIQAGLPVTDKDVEKNIRYALGKGFHTYTKRKLIKRNNDDIRKWLTLAVYATDTDPVIFFLDTGMGQAPEVLYGRPDGNGLIRFVVNANKAKAVTFAAAPYIVDDKTIAKVKKQIGVRT